MALRQVPKIPPPSISEVKPTGFRPLEYLLQTNEEHPRDRALAIKELMIFLLAGVILVAHHASAGAVTGQTGYFNEKEQAGIHIVMESDGLPFTVQIGFLATIAALWLAWSLRSKYHSRPALMGGILVFFLCLPATCGTRHFEQTTGADGHFHFSKVPPGSYHVRLEAPEFEVQGSRSFQVPAGVEVQAPFIILRPVQH